MLDRRRFLVASAALPALLARFARGEDEPPASRPSLAMPSVRAALDRATAVGKPLLVFVVPVEDGARWRFGNAFGWTLRLCTDDLLADLSLCELICATASDVAACAALPPAGANPMLVLVETDGDTLVAKPLAEPALAIPKECFEGTPNVDVARMLYLGSDAGIDAQVLAVARLVHSAVAADETMRARRAKQVDATLTPAERAAVVRFAKSPRECPEEGIDRFAAALLAAASEHGMRDDAIAALARSAERRLRLASPPGAAWAHTDGCGAVVDPPFADPDDQPRIACGMAMIPEKGRRFLMFLSDLEITR